MAYPLHSVLERNALVRAGVVGVVFCALIGGAAFGLLHMPPPQKADVATAETTTDVAGNSPVPTSIPSAEPVAPPAPSLTKNAVIDGSFDSLAAAKKVTTASTDTAAPTEPTKRVVETSFIRGSVAPSSEVVEATEVVAEDTTSGAAPAEPATEVAEAEPAAPPSATGAGKPANIGASAVTVRSGPSVRNGRLFTLAAGAAVRVAASDRGWLKVTASDGRSGWVYSSYVASGAAATSGSDGDAVAAYAIGSSDKTAAIVVGTGVSVRAGPAGSTDRLFALSPGEEVTIVESRERWRKIVDARGRSGWAYAQYLRVGH